VGATFEWRSVFIAVLRPLWLVTRVEGSSACLAMFLAMLPMVFFPKGWIENQIEVFGDFIG
jgi:hypothetical protein